MYESIRTKQCRLIRHGICVEILHELQLDGAGVFDIPQGKLQDSLPDHRMIPALLPSYQIQS